jgi:hypothetical protein
VTAARPPCPRRPMVPDEPGPAQGRCASLRDRPPAGPGPGRPIQDQAPAGARGDTCHTPGPGADAPAQLPKSHLPPLTQARSTDKQGPAWLRWVMNQAAQTAKRSPDFAATYSSIAKRRGKKIATIAVARKLLTRAWHLLAELQAAEASTPPRRP